MFLSTFKFKIYSVCSYNRTPCVTILCSTPAIGFYGRGSDRCIPEVCPTPSSKVFLWRTTLDWNGKNMSRLIYIFTLRRLFPPPCCPCCSATRQSYGATRRAQQCPHQSKRPSVSTISRNARYHAKRLDIYAKFAALAYQSLEQTNVISGADSVMVLISRLLSLARGE